jgi:hypothetical protein
MAPGPPPCDHSETMSITIQLLGRPRITRGTTAGYKLRSRKSWGLLAYLILSERPATRSQLASLLFAEADDPIRALRWCLAEIRRALGDEGSVDGDPVVLRLPPGAVVDVQVVMKGTWSAAVGLPGLGADLLDGMTVKGRRPSRHGCSPSSGMRPPRPRRCCTRPPWDRWHAARSRRPSTMPSAPPR